MLKKVELYEVQDKVRVMDELNEIVDAVNGLEAKVEEHLRGHHEVESATPVSDTNQLADRPSTKKKK